MPGNEYDLASRVRALEVYKESHAEKLDTYVGEIRNTNEKLDAITDKLTEIRVQQKVTHAVAGIIGSAIGSIASYLGLSITLKH